MVAGVFAVASERCFVPGEVQKRCMENMVAASGLNSVSAPRVGHL